MVLLASYRQANVGRIISIRGARYNNSTKFKYSTSSNVTPISKRVIKLAPILNSDLKSRHLISLASILCKNYKIFIARRDQEVVSRFWFIIISKLIDLINTTTENCTVFSWKDRIPHNGPIGGDYSKNITIFEVVKLFKYLSLIRLLDHEAPVSRLLKDIQWANHLFNPNLQMPLTREMPSREMPLTREKPSRELPLTRESPTREKHLTSKMPVSIDSANPFFSRIFTRPPEKAEEPEVPDSCNMSNSPGHLVRYEWVLDESYNFCIPTVYIGHIRSPSDFITALKATLIAGVKEYISLNCDTDCYARMLMYIATIYPNGPIFPVYFNDIIINNLDRIKDQLSKHICANISLLNPRLVAFIANASGIAGDFTLLDSLENYLIGEDGQPTRLAMSLQPDHLENICYAFSRRRVVKRGIFKSLATIVKYKFDEFSPVVTLNLLFSFSRVNYVEMVSKYLINKIQNYTIGQLSGVSEKVLANAMQSLAGFYNNSDLYTKLAQAIISKTSESRGFENDKLIYNSVIRRLLEKGLMDEPLKDCMLYNQLIKLIDL